MFKNKKIIFLDQDKEFEWLESDIKHQLRPAFLFKTYSSLINSLNKYNTKKLNR